MIKKFLASLILCVGGGWLTGLVTTASVKQWYPHLIKSPLTPPDIVFPIVWTILYFLMALSLTIVWNSHSTQKAKALLVFCLQLALNFIWSLLFFYLKSPDFALCDILLLWMCLAYTVVLFWKVSKVAAYY